MNAIKCLPLAGLLLLVCGCATKPDQPKTAGGSQGQLRDLSAANTASIQAQLERPADPKLDRLTPNSKLKKSHQAGTLLHLRQEAGGVSPGETFVPRSLLPNEMAVHAINVGQGDAFLLEFSCSAVLIDTGLQPMNKYKDYLIAYMDWFFRERRPDLNNTLALAVLSHSHTDHANGVPHLFARESSLQILVENKIDNAYEVTAGKEEQVYLKGYGGGEYQPIMANEIHWIDGATSPIVDPVGDCGDGIDPILRVLWGGMAEFPKSLENPNHHSVVMRVDFGEASFLFTGDIQTNQACCKGGGLNLMLDDYIENLDVFDVDALKVSHHGAENGTTQRLLDATTPCLAFMGVGAPEDKGRGSARSHGHPRRGSMELLEDAVSAVRDELDISVFDDDDVDPGEATISKAIFGTAWDGEYVIFANSAGKFSIDTENGETIGVRCGA